MSLKWTTSERLFDKACGLIPGGVNSPVRAFGRVGGRPIFISRASGSRIEDVDGNQYVDFCLSWGPLILGHSHPKVVEAVAKAAQRGLSYGACHEGELALAELVLSALGDFERVRLVNSGTEAVMTALRIARAATGRDLVVKFDGGYHGHFDGMLVKAGSGLATHGIADSDGIPEAIAKTTLVARFDDQDSVDQLFREHGERIAAVIVEPLPANNGLLVQRKAFLGFLRDVTQKHSALLIFDEVISGFRLHFGAYYQLVGVVPDLVVLGKIIGGGMPVGAVVGKVSQMDALSPVGSVYQAGTLSGNPVALAGGIATLDVLKSEPVYEQLECLGSQLVGALEAGNRPCVRVQRAGSVVWLYLDSDPFPRNPDGISGAAVGRFGQIYWKLVESGYYLPPSAYEVMFLCSAHSKGEVEGLAEAVVKTAEASGFGS